MTKTYTVTLTDAEDKALHVVAVTAQEWIKNAGHARCQVAMDAINADEGKRKLDAGEPITGSKDEIVLATQVESAADRNQRKTSALG